MPTTAAARSAVRPAADAATGTPAARNDAHVPDPKAYVAVCRECGHVLGAAVDVPDIGNDVEIAGWMRAGYHVERVTLGEARKAQMRHADGCTAGRKVEPATPLLATMSE